MKQIREVQKDSKQNDENERITHIKNRELNQ